MGVHILLRSGRRPDCVSFASRKEYQTTKNTRSRISQPGLRPEPNSIPFVWFVCFVVAFQSSDVGTDNHETHEPHENISQQSSSADHADFRRRLQFFDHFNL